jgi:phospholipid/cholesterol/gamma-HCH transport system substrate-binding protein
VTRSMIARLVALGVLTVLGLYYILFDAVGIHLTDQPFTVHVVMPNAGGIYSDAYVTYRGVTVGRVAALHLRSDQVVADLAINHGEKIPENVTANVRQLTAAAEQYMDLVPSNADPPYLTPGYTIPASRTFIPTSIGTLLNTLNSLVDGLSASDLNTLTNALSTGLSNAGGDLHTIIEDSHTLIQSLQSAIPGTAQLINSGNTVLSTFNSTSSEFSQFSANLNELTQEVAHSNGALQQLIANGGTANTAFNNFLTANATPTEQLIQNLSSLTGVAYARQAAIKALFEVLPLFASDVAATTTNGQIRFELTFNSRETVCPYTTSMAEPTSLVPIVNLTGNCNAQAADLLQRGADKAP